MRKIQTLKNIQGYIENKEHRKGSTILLAFNFENDKEQSSTSTRLV